MATFFLIQVDPGHAQATAAVVADIAGVGEVRVTSGPYDVIAESAAKPEHQQRIRAEIRAVPGLSRLCVCHGSDQERRVAS